MQNRFKPAPERTNWLPLIVLLIIAALVGLAVILLLKG